MIPSMAPDGRCPVQRVKEEAVAIAWRAKSISFEDAEGADAVEEDVEVVLID